MMTKKQTPSAGTASQAAPAAASTRPRFYHCYFCPAVACLKSSNPTPGAVHQRGVHLSTDKPRTDVRCPGCGGQMVIARDGLTTEGAPHPDGHITADRDGNAVLFGNPLIHEAPGQPDQTGQIDAESDNAVFSKTFPGVKL